MNGGPLPYLWVGLGGFLGANARYILGIWITGRTGDAWPYHTFAINITGGLAIGFILTVLTARFPGDPAWRLFLVVGFLGGYTTFSSYTFEGLALLRSGAYLGACAYILGSNLLGLLATFLGVALAQASGWGG
jgi:CrcB protein